jgi:uncharacterized coiled-coil DUF342 family protein
MTNYYEQCDCLAYCQEAPCYDCLKKEVARLRDERDEYIDKISYLVEEAEDTEKEIKKLRAENERLREALEATEAVKAFMALPKSYYDDDWSDEKESRFLASVGRLAEAKKALEATK